MLTLIFAPGRGLPLAPHAPLLLELSHLGRGNPGLSAQLPVTTFHGEGSTGQLVNVTGERGAATGCVHLRHGRLHICQTEVSHALLLLITGQTAKKAG